MKAAFLISVSYAILGFLYAPGANTFVALVFIFISCTPFAIGALYEPRAFVNVHRAPSQLLFWGVFALGLANLVIIAVSVDMSPVDIISPVGFVSIAGASTVRRYEEQSSSGSPILLALSLLLVYRIGATDAAVSAWRKVLGFLPLLLYSLLSTEKWPMFLAFVFFLSGLFISRPYQEARDVALRYVMMFIVLGAGLAGLALVLRGFDGDLIELSKQLLHYMLAPYPALGSWLITDASRQCCTFGALSFIGPLDALGTVHREAGVYLVNFIIYGIETNIYTVWRYLVQDFSLLGPFLLNSMMAFIFIALRTIRWVPASLAVSGFATISAILSTNVTPFVHNSVAFAMVLALSYSMIRVQRTKSALYPTPHE